MNHTIALNNYQAQATNPTAIRGAFGQMFNKAASRAKWRRVLSWFSGRSTQLMALDSANHNGKKRSRVQQVALDEIVGSEGRCGDFDDQFLPLQKHSRDRWINIALARHKQVVLPPIELIQTDAGYFVRDGHHRISVARMYGQAMIEAVII